MVINYLHFNKNHVFKNILILAQIFEKSPRITLRRTFKMMNNSVFGKKVMENPHKVLTQNEGFSK